jgi:hypothetical protein
MAGVLYRAGFYRSFSRYAREKVFGRVCTTGGQVRKYIDFFRR